MSWKFTREGVRQLTEFNRQGGERVVAHNTIRLLRRGCHEHPADTAFHILTGLLFNIVIQ